MKTDKVYMAGSGLICSMGSGVDDVFRKMVSGEDGFRELHRFPTEDYVRDTGGIVSEEMEDQLREKYGEHDIAELFVKAAGEEALANLTLSPDDTIGLVLATNFGLMETMEWTWREQFDTSEINCEDVLDKTCFCERMAEYFNCNGPKVQIAFSCASGAAAVVIGKQWLDQGRATKVLCIGYDALTEYTWCGLNNLRTITEDKLRPFDKRRAGTIFSEGAAAVLLSRDNPAAISVAGGALNNNAYHMTAPSPEARGSYEVMKAALKDADLKPADIDLICAHATGTCANDVTESAALGNLFGEKIADIYVTAFKSQIGHLMGAAGIAEIVITAKALETSFIPPIINSEEHDEECKVKCVKGKALKSNIKKAITNSAGIGGNNSAIVLVKEEA